ncbi:glycosyl transferase [Runella slithyformis]|uniref:Glycosyl transferase, group 1 n=1 Tax=Runella slithyformis (strain ATCC 29530 / DSM 19594 / LMG 11500 / NCIMB 11436 / LSU 4) TaxID=761193 RepID=A0A7U3ZIU0_RUNSL|nr:glycosyl transferase [Runella slithyformis]AEI47993.1 glycosyl transferase, group 1 [Runella slithyformis DSM 19594]
MTLAFTLCSINYLAQARTLGDSLKRTNPHIRFVIGLVDRLDTANVPADKLPEFEILELHRIGMDGLDKMCEHYNITELNTAVKPYFFRYFLKKIPQVKNVIYFDPDIIVYQPLTQLEALLEKNDFVLTPHLTTPIDDQLTPNELHHLNTGVYNLGFIALTKSPEALDFVKWWEEKLFDECKIDLCNGLFVDQHWVNFAPVFWNNVHVEKHPGWNAAYWNLHERVFTQQQGRHFVNGLPVVFFHYSGYDPAKPSVISKYQDRFTFDRRPDLNPLFDYYREELLRNHNAYYRQFPCYYIKSEPLYKYQRIRALLKKPFEKWLERL